MDKTSTAYWGSKKSYDHAATAASFAMGWFLGELLSGHSAVPFILSAMVFLWNAVGYFCTLVREEDTCG